MAAHRLASLGPRDPRAAHHARLIPGRLLAAPHWLHYRSTHIIRAVHPNQIGSAIAAEEVCRMRADAGFAHGISDQPGVPGEARLRAIASYEKQFAERV